MRSTVYLLPIALVLASPTPAAAQATDSSATTDRWSPATLLTPGSLAEDAIRTHQLHGTSGAAEFLFRAPSHFDDADHSRRADWHLVPLLPELRNVWNSALPFSLNDGALWAGRGWSARLSAGARLDAGPVTAVLAPQLVHSQNRGFQIFPSPAAERSDYASPWYSGERSMDLPHRFGNAPLTQLDPGQSSITLRLGGVAMGAATENQWWGPGIRNALVLSNHAAGFPHLFLRTAKPVDVGVGTFRAKWILGGLTESLYFDDDPSNDHRSLSGLVLSFTPGVEPDLTLGLARTVVADLESRSSLPLHGVNSLRHWGPRAEADQITSLFLRWLFPAAGLETYLEWSRLELPTSLRSLLVAPHHTQGYTLGTQWARPAPGEGLLRLQGELTYLEMSATYRHATVPTYYVGRATEHGYTHRGQLLGAAIGPGSSSQWLALDYLAGPRQLGLFGGRIRWENDTYYHQPTGFSFWSHDVSLYGGVRGALPLAGAQLTFGMTAMHRYNYLFQNHNGGYLSDPTWDRNNFTFELSLVPRGIRSPE